MTLRRFNNAIQKLEEYFLIVGTIACVLTVVIQIVYRWILKVSVPWTDEVARYIFVWVCWIGAAAAMRENSHIDVTLIDTILSKTKNAERNLKIIDTVSIVLSVVLISIFVSVYWDYYVRILTGNQVSVVMKLHLKWPMGSVLVGSGLMIYHGIYNLLPKRLIGETNNKTMIIQERR